MCRPSRDASRHGSCNARARVEIFGTILASRARPCGKLGMGLATRARELGTLLAITHTCVCAFRLSTR